MARVVDLTFRSKAAESPRYRPDIEGLRAIAVVSVILFHAKIKGFSGGFVGVDVFFVISGYLITGIIERDLARDRFSLLSFYGRRIRRIFPALIALLIFCTLLGAWLFPPQQLKNYAWGLLTVAGFASNIYFAVTTGGIDYFGAAAGAQLLLHTWSLAVEEQFYLLFPCLLFLLHKFVRPRRQTVLLLLLGLSFSLSVWGVRAFPTPTFYLLPGRAWELLLGALLALRPLPLLQGFWTRSLAGAIGLAGIVYATVGLSEATSFPGIDALFPCVGTGLVLYAGERGVSHERSSLADLILGCRPFVFLGLISYSLYLWHWPILVFAQYYYAGLFPSGNELILPLLLTLVLAVLSFEFIESPFRNTRHTVDTSRRTLWGGVGANAAMALVSLALIATNGLPQRYPPEKVDRLTTNYARRTDTVDLGDCVNYRRPLSQYSQADFCTIGLAHKNILFWGDSHVAQLYPVLQDLQQHNQLHGEGIVLAIAGACPPAEGMNQIYPGFHCDALGRYTMVRATQEDIDTVFIQFAPWWTMSDGRLCAVEAGRCKKTLTGHEAAERFLAELPEHIRALRQSGRRVILGLPFPLYNRSIPDLEIRSATLGPLPNHAGHTVDLTPMEFRDRLKDLAAATGAEVFDPRETLCPGNVCVYQVNGLSLYSDESHLAKSQVGIMEPGLLKALDPRP